MFLIAGNTEIVLQNYKKIFKKEKNFRISTRYSQLVKKLAVQLITANFFQRFKITHATEATEPSKISFCCGVVQ